ncbi:MAG: protein kinase [Phycisphaerae bacterium]|nr:protein kinase [Phycisphaerae bacterium]
MDCSVSDEQLWSWFDRNAPELDEHLAHCPRCRARAAQFRGIIDAVHTEHDVTEHVIPDSIGSYRIVRVIGEGGMGIVYEAEQQMPRRAVAMKVLKRRETLEEPLERRFEEEMQALARLRHAFIGTIYEAGQTPEGLRYLVMELATGAPLDEYCRRHELSKKECLLLFEKICQAIDHAHKQDVIHHDLKPTNILVDDEGNPKIVDFGLARVTSIDGVIHNDRNGVVIGGTPAYMSPERVRGAPEGDCPTSDVYSLGVVLYQMLTGTLPNDLGSGANGNVGSCEPTDAEPAATPRLSQDLLAVLRKAMARMPERRYVTVASLLRDVQRCIHGDVPQARHASPLYVAGRRLRRHWLFVSALAVLLAVLGITVQRDLARRDTLDPAEGRRIAMRIMQDLEEGRGRAAATALPELVELYPDLPDTSLVCAQVKYWTNPYALDATKQYLADQLALDPGRQWWCRLLQSEVYRAADATRSPDTPPRGRRWEESRSAEVWYLRSLATLDMATRLACAREAVAVDSTSEFARARLTRLERATGQWEAALAGADQLITRGADRWEWTEFKGDTYMIMDQPGNAAAQYAGLIELNPGLAEPYRRRGHALLLQGEVSEAHDAYCQAIARDTRPPRDPWLYYERAVCRRALGDRPGAVADLTEARRLLGKPSRVDAALYVLHAEAGRTDEAGNIIGLASQFADERELDRIFAFLGNAVTADVPIDESRTPAERCAAYYWVGEKTLLGGDHAAADEYFRQALEVDVICDPRRFPEPLSERILARWRLSAGRAELAGVPLPEKD